jgi:phage-related minor tail protein
MTDFNLKATLTGDAGPLNAALRQGGQGVEGVADKVVAANKQMADAAKGTAAAQTQAAAVTKGAAAEAEASARRSAGATNEAYAAQQRAMRDARAEANNLKQAYRQLPAQMTDVVTSLSSGMPVWQVAIQQGGQIKDSFGGFAGVAREVTKAVNPMTVAIGGAAAAGVVLAVAYNQGASELQAYNRAIVMSGNAAGVTAGRLDAMARSIDQVVGTQGAAAEALAMLAATGNVSAGQLELVATTALHMQRTLGVAVADTVEEFSALGKKPVQAVTALNEKYHFLTIAVYEQIRAAEKRGATDVAGAIAQEALAKAQTERMVKLDAQLGSIERGWRAVKEGAKEAWDAMAGIGRKDTTEQQLAAVEAALSQPVRRGGNALQAEERRAALLQRKEDLQETLRLARLSASHEAQTANDTESWIAAQAKRDAAIKAAADAYKGLIGPIEQRIAMAQAEMVAGRELTAVEQKLLQVKEGMRQANIAENSEKGKQILAAAQTAGVLETEIAARHELAQILERERAAAYARGTEAEKEAEASIKANDQMRKEIAAMGAKGEALLVLEHASISSAIATKETALAALDATGATTRESEALREQIALLRERLGLLGRKGDKADKIENAAANDKARSREEEENRRRADGLANSITDGIMRGARTGENIMQVFRTQLEDEFARVVLKPIVSPIADATNQFIGMLLNAGMAYLSGGNSTSQTPVTDGIKFENAKVGHSGGVMGFDRMDGTRRLPSAMFESAPRYHKGMLAPDEHAAVLQTGESVLTPAQLRQVASMGAGLQVNVINQTGTPVKATSQANASGGFDVILTAVEDAMADRVASGTGALHGAFAQRFGARSTFNS